jgi:hypothetical protein
LKVDTQEKQKASGARLTDKAARRDAAAFIRKALRRKTPRGAKH